MTRFIKVTDPVNEDVSWTMDNPRNVRFIRVAFSLRSLRVEFVANYPILTKD